MKQLIEKEFLGIVNRLTVGGESINEVQRNVLEQIDDKLKKSLCKYDRFISNNLREFNVNSTYLDVISLKDSFIIIKECWTDIFAKYFGNTMYSEWECKFLKCGKVRNPIAHGHEEYLSELDKNEVDIYCKQIFDTISSNYINTSVPSEDEVLKVASHYKTQ